MLARVAFIAFLWQQSAKLSEFALQLVMFKITSVYLGTHGAGTYAVVGTLIGLVLSGIELGYEASANNFISRASDLPGRISFLVRALFNRRLLLSAAASFALFVLAEPVARWQGVADANLFRLGAVTLFFTSVSGILTYVLLALFNNKQVMFIRLAALLLQVGLLFLMLRAGYGVWGALVAQTAGAAVMLLGCAPLSLRYASPKPEPMPLRPVFSFGITLWIQNLMNFALGKAINILLLGAFGFSKGLIGEYNAAFNLRTLVDTMFIMGMGATALAATARLAEKGGAKQLPIAWTYNLKATTLLSVPPLVFFLLHTPAGIIALADKAFLDATEPARWLILFAIAARIFGGGASSTVLTADGKERFVLRQFIIGGLTNLALGPILIPFWGMGGVVVATGFSTVLVSFLGYRMVRRHYRVKFPTTYTLKVLFASMLATLATYPFSVPKLGPLLGSAALFVVVFVLLLRLLRPFDQQDIEVAGKIGKKMSRFIRPFAQPARPAKEESVAV